MCHQLHVTASQHCVVWPSAQQHTHTHLTTLFPGLPGWAGTRKVKPIWILLEQETVSGSGISWAICKSCISLETDNHASTTPLKVFYRPDALPAAQPTASKHWRHWHSTALKISCNFLADYITHWCHSIANWSDVMWSSGKWLRYKQWNITKNCTSFSHITSAFEIKQ